MSTLQKLSEIEACRNVIQHTGQGVLTKKNTDEKVLSARERISRLLDEKSFVEIGTFMKSRLTAFNGRYDDTPCDGLVCGYGTIKGRLVYVYSQDKTVLGGAVGEVHAKKIVRVYEDALKVGAPVIGFIDTVGLRLQESIDGLDGYGLIFQKMTEASGVIPQITVVCGDCAGGVSILAGLSDFTFIATQSGRLFLNSPNTFEEKNCTWDTIASPEVHLKESGLLLSGHDDEGELLDQVSTLLGYLPAHNKDDVPYSNCTDDLNRMDEWLDEFDFEQHSVETIVASVVDSGVYLELYKQYGNDTMVAFGRMNGETVGFIANKDVAISYEGIKKMIRFIQFCDAFNIPIVSLTRSTYFKSSIDTEKHGIIKEVSRLVHAFTSATVPKINIILKEAYGTAYVVMNSRHIGADCVYAWPSAEVMVMNSRSATKILYGETIEEAEKPEEMLEEKTALYERMNSGIGIAQRGYIDDVIEPAATRKRIIAALEVLHTKKVVQRYKKHSTV